MRKKESRIKKLWSGIQLINGPTRKNGGGMMGLGMSEKNEDPNMFLGLGPWVSSHHDNAA